jgi:hypothetical protein
VAELLVEGLEEEVVEALVEGPSSPTKKAD